MILKCNTLDGLTCLIIYRQISVVVDQGRYRKIWLSNGNFLEVSETLNQIESALLKLIVKELTH